MIAKLRLSVCKIHHFFSLIKHVTLIFLIIPAGLNGQYLFDFECDGSGSGSCSLFTDWEQVPANRWCCDSAESIEGGASLHHCFDNGEEGCDYLLFLHDQLIFTDSFSVSFRIRHRYAPSSQNNWQVALAAELEGGEDPAEKASDAGSLRIVNGIVVGVNFSGSDDLVRIWGVDQGTVTELCMTPLNYQEQVGTELAPMFTLTGDGRGKIDLYWSPDPGYQSPVLLGSCTTDRFPTGRHLVVRYRYSASRDMGLWMDRLNMEGHFEQDTLPPSVTGVRVVKDRSLLVQFSEPVVKVNPGDFRLTSAEEPGGLAPDSLRKEVEGYFLSFPRVISNRMPHILGISGIEDLDGNILLDTMVPLMRNEAVWGDVIFNEIMADPEPAVKYADEYLELFNRSDYEVDLDGWLLKVNERNYLMDPYILIPGDYYVFNNIVLPNEGALLSLYSKEEKLVHAVSYSRPWDGEVWKKDGGWSIEWPDPGYPCMIPSAWEYSTDPAGGTPGRVNSNMTVIEDNEPPVLLYAGINGPGSCLLYYSEPLRLPEMDDPDVILDPGGAVPESVELVEPLSDVVQLSFSEEFSEWTSYRLSLSGLTDCSGNVAGIQEYRAGRVTQPFYGSLLINEIMFDPEENAPAFVELYTPGEGTYDLQDLAIHLVEEGGVPDSPLPLAAYSRLILPGQYLVLSECVPQLQESYGLDVSGCWVEVKGISGIKRSGGVIYLTDRAGNVVDRVGYNNDMHMELIDNTRGVSLERISGERPGNDPDNWHSAASIEGYATPGRENSQSTDGSEPDRLLDVRPEVFSPDNDGYNDLLHITVATGEHGWIISLLITDLQGNRVRILANNDLSGPAVTYIWDGEGENGAMQLMGYYVVHLRGYDPVTGKRFIRRRAVGLVYR